MSFAAPFDAKESRVWIDGCFDFAHHGHAGAMLQAKQIGKELYVGIHSDEEILKNKGPTVMNLSERVLAVEACKWADKSISDAPYVTDPDFLDKYGCKYAIHGDDITTDANGEDCYKIVKDLGRFIVVKRTPSISTTDLVGRMLLLTKDHHIKPIIDVNDTTHPLLTKDSVERYRQYATDSSGLKAGSDVFIYNSKLNNFHELISGDHTKKFQKIYYITGTFDLFHPGHISLLKIVSEKAKLSNAKVVVGVLDDFTSNHYKGLNYPIMTIFERSLCVLQCKYVDSIILGAPYINNKEYLTDLKKLFNVEELTVFHGSTVEIIHESTNNDSIIVPTKNMFELEKSLGIFEKIQNHPFDNISTEVIVSRVLDNRKVYEERQRKKGWKSEKEKTLEQVEKGDN